MLPAGFRLGDNDTRILAVALNLQAEGPTSRWCPRTCRCGSRRRRSACPPRSTARSSRSRPAGPAWPRSRWPPTTLDTLYDDERRSTSRRRATCRATPGWCCSPSAAARSGRVTPDKRVRLVRGDREAFGLRGRSAEQRIALDLLLDPEIGIVSLGGRAGTGKSALALCAGLEAVLERRQHRKVVVFRPLYAVGGQELGYLPAASPRRCSPWAQAVFDTLGAAGRAPT